MKSATFSRHVFVSLRVLGLALVVLALFGLTAFLCAAGISLVGITQGFVPLGITCAVIIWLFVVVFHFRREKVALPFGNRGAFLRQLQAELADLGYEPGGETSCSWIFRPGFLALLAGGVVRVDLADGRMTLTGPKVCLERLRRRLRLNDHVRQARTPTTLTRRVPVITMAQEGAAANPAPSAASSV